GAAIKSAAVASVAAVRAAVASVAATGTALARKAATSVPTSIPTGAVARAQAVLRRRPTQVLAAAAVAGLAVIWLGWRLLHGHSAPAQPASTHAQPVSQPAPPPATAVQNAGTPNSGDSAVLHQEIPDVPRHARESIRGRIKVTVRVSVDRSGSVVAARLVIPGSSRYFARQAIDSAMKWKFVPADKQNSRQWLLRFEFTRAGATGQAAGAPT
ncbi:MAG: TonB family protein, partial [Steroidobacteraceae bacterium]